MATKNSKSLYVAALALFLSCVGYLMFAGITSNSVYFLNVSEALAMPPDKLHAARLFGTVREDGLRALEEGAGVRFQLEDKDDAGEALWVVYQGAVPDTFKAGAEVIVEGVYDAENNRVTATVLMTKCPSKYQKENRG